MDVEGQSFGEMDVSIAAREAFGGRWWNSNGWALEFRACLDRIEVKRKQETQELGLSQGEGGFSGVRGE